MAPTPIPVHPLAQPGITNGQLTLSALLQQPTVITRSLVLFLNQLPDLSTAFFGGSSGGVTGGAIVYEEAPTKATDDLTRRGEEIAPAAEYPLIGAEVGEEKMATVTKYGGKFYITDEARDRNATFLYPRLAQQLAAKIADTVNRAGIAQADAALVAAGQTATVSDWGAYDPNDAVTTNNVSPAENLTEIQVAARPGVSYNTLVLSDLDAMAYGRALARSSQVLTQPVAGAPTAPNPNVINVGTSLPTGTGYLIEAGALGGMRTEQALRTVTYRAEDTDRTWVQAGVRPLFFVDNPAAGVKLTIPGSAAIEGFVTLGSGFSRPVSVNPG